MARLLNPLAPHLAGTLSPDVEAGVKALLASGALADGATPDEAALRRDARAADEESVMRPAFLRDTEKIIHMPAYNRLSGKTRGADSTCSLWPGSPVISAVPWGSIST